MELQSNIFNITKVRNGVDANSRRITTNVETIYKFPVDYTEENEQNLITYSLSPDIVIIGVLDTFQGTALDVSNATFEINLNGVNLKEIISPTTYITYFNRKRTPQSNSNDNYHWYFHIQDFYNDLYDGTLTIDYDTCYKEAFNIDQDIFNSDKTIYWYKDSTNQYVQCTNESVFDSSTTYYTPSASISYLYSFFESQFPTYIEFNGIIDSSLLYYAMPFQIGSNLDIAKFSMDPVRGFLASMQNAGIRFDSNGLEITNGNFTITNSNNEAVLNFNKEDGTLAVTGQINATSGFFSGELRAATGSFSGTITAATGTIGGFTIDSNSIFSDDLILNSTTSNNESSIYVKNITLGIGALIEKYLKIGNFSLLNPQSTTGYINYDNSIAKLIQPHSQITVDPEPINGKNYYTLSGNEYILFTGNDFESGVTYYEDGIYFQLTNEGFVNGNNWSIKKEPGDDYVTARFGKLIAEDGEFNGIIRARDGVFSGEVTSSVISASTINTANFVTEKTRSMGGAFIFKPTFEIEDIQIDENEEYTLFFTLSSNALEYFSLDGVNDKIIAISGVDVRFGKLDSIDVQNNKIGVTFSESDYNILSANDALDNYQTLTLFGEAENDVLIGINSDNNNVGDILPPRALTIKTFTNLQNTNSKIGDIDYGLKLLLGDLATLGINNLNGYGLYSDNVYLHGSLITEDDTGTYAGIHTIKDIQFNYTTWNEAQDSTPVNEKIIFWGGSNSLAERDIQQSPFIITDKGSIYARQGEFKGAVIADSVITNTIIETPIIRGTGYNEEKGGPTLKIYDTNSEKAGIGFYKLVNNLDAQSDETNDVLTLNINNTGFTHYYNSNPFKFIDFNEYNSSNPSQERYINFYGTEYNAGTTTFSSKLIKDGSGGAVSKIIISGTDGKVELSYGQTDNNNGHGIQINTNGIRNFGGKVVNEGETTFQNTNDTNHLSYKINSHGYYCLYVKKEN